MSFHYKPSVAERRKRLRAEAAARQGHCCKYCFEPFSVSPATADHRKPRSAGGMNFADNIDAACVSCNSLKGSMSAGAFLKAIKAAAGPLPMLLAYARRRIWLSAHRASRNIGRAAGVEINNPLTLSEAA